MKVNDIVTLSAHTEHYSRGVIGQTYKIAELKKTELKLCSLEGNMCFYTIPANVSPAVIMSVPAGMEFGVDYDIDKLWTRSSSGPIQHRKTLEFGERLDIEVKAITDLLKEKNKAYGNTALNPTNIFSGLDATEAICARIDDKLARIKNKGINDKTEDTVDDLIGYLLLLKMSM
jgi:hypothetical protein